MSIDIATAAGFTANIMSNLAFIPQIVKSFRRKRVEDVSILMFAVLFTTQVCWIIYAIPIHASNLWTSSLIEIALLTPIFVMWVKYRKNKSISTRNDKVIQFPTQTKANPIEVNTNPIAMID